MSTGLGKRTRDDGGTVNPGSIAAFYAQKRGTLYAFSRMGRRAVCPRTARTVCRGQASHHLNAHTRESTLMRSSELTVPFPRDGRGRPTRGNGTKIANSQHITRTRTRWPKNTRSDSRWASLASPRDGLRHHSRRNDRPTRGEAGPPNSGRMRNGQLRPFPRDG